ncbi:hypothetical protein SAMN06265222_11942 [Neorhodopirellula lusitana]|uniref:Secreted protein n=1 Tax=Neorhodopirellula lusitana TaxID=445327 RepID=A0ABY1QMA6_9BACT|nr:hypothetical protein SAMN06265222_11942 [Neorhodopirellula lusitana]
MNIIFASKWPAWSRISAVALLIHCLGITPAVADNPTDSLNGIYAEPSTFLNDQGREVTGFQMDRAVLELQGDRFKYWHFSDCIGFQEYPISGTYSRDGDLLELHSDDLAQTERRYVATTINGVPGVWPENELQAWRNGEHPYSVPILVRVADGPSGKELDQTTFQFPPITPLLNKETAKQFWTWQTKKHEARYMDVPEPLRTLLREQSNRDDDTREGYQKLVLNQHQELDPKLIKQLVSEIGSGVSVSVGPMVLQDLFGLDSAYFDVPEFTKSDATKRAAIQRLVNVMSEAKNERALTAVLLVFLRTTGLKQIDLTCASGEQVKISWDAGRQTMESFDFSEAVRSDCQRWANERLAERFGAVE